MRALFATIILTTLATGIHAGINPQGTNDIGTFKTFTDPFCQGGQNNIDIPDKDSMGTLEPDVVSVKAEITARCICTYSYD